jgi:hypothetical protein
MREKLWIYGGLLLFLVGVTFPVWRDAITHATTQPPALEMPANQKQCVAPTDYMLTSHMKLLMDWRTSAVRDNNWKYTSFNGKVYQKRFSGTCLQCHSKAKFCDRCHTYVGARTPYCWNCHVDPALVKGATP